MCGIDKQYFPGSLPAWSRPVPFPIVLLCEQLSCVIGVRTCIVMGPIGPDESYKKNHFATKRIKQSCFHPFKIFRMF